MANTCTVYGLRFKGNEHYCYVGSSFDHDARFIQHCNQLRNLTHINTGLMGLVLENGLEALEIEVLAIVDIQQRFTEEYGWIERLTNEGHKLTNIIRSAKQEVHIRKQHSLGRDVIRTAVRMYQFGNRLDPASKLWIQLLGTQKLFIDLLHSDMFSELPANEKEEAMCFINKLPIPMRWEVYA